jgi:hypothetical protein
MTHSLFGERDSFTDPFSPARAGEHSLIETIARISAEPRGQRQVSAPSA